MREQSELEKRWNDTTRFQAAGASTVIIATVTTILAMTIATAVMVTVTKNATLYIYIY